MPRKAFIADLKEAVSSSAVPGISDIHDGEEDGSFTFSFTPSIGESIPIKIQALVPGKCLLVNSCMEGKMPTRYATDVGEYPSSHQFYLYTISDTVPSKVSTTLEQLTETAGGLRIHQLLSAVSTSLSGALRPGSQNNDDDPMSDGESQTDGNEYDMEYEDYDHSLFRGGSPLNIDRHRGDETPQPKSTLGGFDSEDLDDSLKTRIRQDLRAAKDAGLKVSILGNLMRAGGSGFVSVSCRISKLGISQEAMKAWGLHGDHYLIFLIRYNLGYMTAERLAAGDNFQVRRSIEMHVRVSTRYKPTLEQAVAVFASELSKKTTTASSRASGQEEWNGKPHSASEGELNTIFIGRPLDQLLKDRLVVLLKSRIEIGLNWAAAERFYNDIQGKNLGTVSDLLTRYYDPDPPSSILPAMVTADHVSENKSYNALSFPLLGMQFVFRHLVRCTEFCLVCHCRVTSTSEALKPYVCDKPLCLYQYMTLGFGPSLEYEIRSQPEVVDLLVSFCYAAAKGKRLAGLPTGMGLMVPPPPTASWNDGGFLMDPTAGVPTSSPAAVAGGFLASVVAGDVLGTPITQTQPTRFEVTINRDELKISFKEDKGHTLNCPVKIGDWVAIREPSENRTSHCQIAETAYFPMVTVAQFITAPQKVNDLLAGSRMSNRSNNDSTTTTEKRQTEGQLVIYDQNFDNMTSAEKHETINYLLDILPGILEIKNYLSRKAWAENSLAKWTDRISPALLGILRWIVASNRSCIMYVSSADSTREGENGEQAVYGMEGWMQFRFAQGAPDKEQRFINSLQRTTARLGLRYPSIFAWHGSPLMNWHGIIREGLHFKRRDHGRAFGDGCYHSLDYHTSAGYSQVHHGHPTYEVTHIIQSSI